MKWVQGVNLFSAIGCLIILLIAMFKQDPVDVYIIGIATFAIINTVIGMNS